MRFQEKYICDRNDHFPSPVCSARPQPPSPASLCSVRPAAPPTVPAAPSMTLPPSGPDSPNPAQEKHISLTT